MLALSPKGSHSRFESSSCVIVPYCAGRDVCIDGEGACREPGVVGDIAMCWGPEKGAGYGPGPLGVSRSASSIKSPCASYSCSDKRISEVYAGNENGSYKHTELIHVALERRRGIIAGGRR